jgi:HYDIN/CFA65/VesB family protein
MKLANGIALVVVLAATSMPMGAAASAPAVKLTPSSLVFGKENPEGPYSPQTTTLSNTGDGMLVISNITVENPSPGDGADFTQTNNCYPFPRTLAPGQSCSIQVGFFPGEYGVRQGTVVITDNAPGSPHRLGLTGYAYPFKAMYTLEGFGGLHPANPISPSMPGGGYWRGWKIARAAVLLADASGGYTLDGYGGAHPFGSAPVAAGAAYFGWDIARDIVLLPGLTASDARGYVLDGWGALHPFGGAPPVTGAAYWPRWDIAKRVKLLPDGSGGYVLDGWGGLHPFGVGNNAPPRGIADTAYWPGWSIARDFDLFSNSTPATAAGFTLDGYGGVHPFGFRPNGPVGPSGYWPRWDIARSIHLNPTSTTATPFGWTMEGFGGVHAFAGGQSLPPGPYWPRQDIAVKLVVAR